MSELISKPPRILIVSDHPANADLLEESLGDEEYRIASICNTRVALKTVAAYEADLVLLDFSDSDSSGCEICRRMKADHESREIPVLIVVSLNEIGDIEQAIAAGCDDFLTAPVDVPQLQTRIRSLIRVKMLRDKAQRLRDELSE